MKNSNWPYFMVLTFFVFGITFYDIVNHAPARVDKDLVLVENLKAECEEVHQTECEISVFYLPKANKTNDGR